MNRPTLASIPLSTFSLYETARSRRPMLVTVLRIHVSSVTSGTSDWRKNVALAGSRPRAR